MTLWKLWLKERQWQIILSNEKTIDRESKNRLTTGKTAFTFHDWNLTNWDLSHKKVSINTEKCVLGLETLLCVSLLSLWQTISDPKVHALCLVKIEEILLIRACTFILRAYFCISFYIFWLGSWCHIIHLDVVLLALLTGSAYFGQLWLLYHELITLFHWFSEN